MCFWWGPPGHWQNISKCVLSFPSSGAESSRFSTSFAVMNPSDATEGKKGFRFLKQGLRLKALDKDEWLELLVLSCIVCDVYHALDLSALLSNCKKGLIVLHYYYLFSSPFYWKLFLYYLGAHHFGTGTRLFWAPHIVGDVWVFPLPRILSYLLSSRR